MGKTLSLNTTLRALPPEQLLAMTVSLHDQLKAKVAAGKATQQEIAAVNTARKAIAVHLNHAGRKA